MTDRADERILIIGRSIPLIEGVADLLQVVGYPVELSSGWADATYVSQDMPPNLIIVDLSFAAPDVYRLAEDIRSAPGWSDVPLLFLSFSGDDRIRDLQRRTRKNGDKRLHFYTHTLLSMDELLETVRICLS
jgi:PleD family two-component response regulator